MCESEDMHVLSDVHINIQPTKVDEQVISCTAETSDNYAVPQGAMSGEGNSSRSATKLYKSRFIFKVPCLDTSNHETANNEFEETVGANCVKDDDGDLLPSRRISHTRAADNPLGDNPQEVIILEHCMQTSLANVGLQVWQGSLLMCDFILSHAKDFEDCIAIELGGGLGLSSITMAMVARITYCTDVGCNVLDKCSDNVKRNQQLAGLISSCSSQICVRELDWTQPELNRDTNSMYSWNKEDEENLSKATVVFAADCIYDNTLTDAFFKTLISIMTIGCHKTMYISLERRYNFTLSDLDVTCKEYDYFQSHLRKLVDTHLDKGVKFKVSQIATDFDQFFDYNRVAQLELWEVTISK